MGKLHNIATGIMMTGAILGLGKEAVSQTTGNSNGAAGIGQIQDSTKSQLIGLDQYDYKKMLYMEIGLLSPEVVNKVMFDRINEIRKEYKLPALKYDTRIENVAREFAQEKDGTDWMSEYDPHANARKEGQYARFERHGLADYLKLTKVNKDLEGIGENMIEIDPRENVYGIMLRVKDSPSGHRDNIVSPYINSMGQYKGKSIIVQNFAYMIK